MLLTAAQREFHAAQQFYLGEIAMHPHDTKQTLFTVLSTRSSDYYQLMTKTSSKTDPEVHHQAVRPSLVLELLTKWHLTLNALL